MIKRFQNNLGSLGEDFACNFLTSKGYKIIERNFRSRFGEIDIVAAKDTKLIFIEVKARRNLKFGCPEEAVTENKIRKISKTAEYYMLLHPDSNKSLGLEVASILFEGDKPKEIKIIDIGA